MMHRQPISRIIVGIFGLLLFIFAAGELLLRFILALVGLALFAYGFAWRKQEAYTFIHKHWYNYKKDNF